MRPPYGSSFPNVIPTEEELKARYNSFEERKRDIDYAQSEIWFSVIGGGDFARYVIGTNSGHFEWSNRRLDESEQPTRKEQFEAFKATLTVKQQTALERYQSLLDNIAFYRRLEPSRRKEYFSSEFTDEQLDAAIVDAENRLRKQLGKRKSTNLTSDIIHYLHNPHEDELAFDISLAQRWILQRVFDLGWTVDRFGKFDRYVNSNDARKPERIGKKYQWIAYHEFLAHVADNFVFRGDGWRRPEGKSYDGPWQDMYIRDIDPSWILPNTQETTSLYGFSPTWWAPVSKDWDADLPNHDWIPKHDDLPAIEPLIAVSNPDDNSQWLTLEGSYRWEHPEGDSDDEYHYPRRTAHYSLQGYLLQKMHADALYEWMKTQWRATRGFRLPDSHPLYRVFLGEFFWAPAFLYHYVPYHHHDDWVGGEPDDTIPHPLLVTTDQYTQEGNSFDCSIEETVHVYLPCKRIADMMGLRWNGIEGQFIDAQGRLIAIDPSVHSKGPGALLIRREPFLAYLEENGLEILWVITGEKLIITGNALGDKDWVGRLNILGVYRLNGITVQGELLTNVSD